MIGLPSRHICAHWPTREPSDEFGDRLAGRVAAALAVGRRALIEARAECCARAGEHDDLDGAVGVGLVEGAVQLGLQIGGDRIHALRTVERDGRDSFAHAVDQILIGHCPCLFLGGPALSAEARLSDRRLSKAARRR
jgi:hypothetical protein